MNLKSAVAAVLASTAAIAAAQQKLEGRYYWFQGDKKPGGNTFKTSDGPMACLVILPGNKWSMTFIMREDIPNKGSYRIAGNRLTLMESGRSGSFFVLERRGSDLKPVSGAYTSSIGMLYRMPSQWEKSFADQGRRASYLSQASQLSKAFLMYAYDNDEKLPRAQKQLEKEAFDYVSDKRLYVGFVYTFKGGKLPPESKRANFVLGYVKSPYGIAEILANGGARWKKY